VLLHGEVDVDDVDRAAVHACAYLTLTWSLVIRRHHQSGVAAHRHEAFEPFKSPQHQASDRGGDPTEQGLSAILRRRDIIVGVTTAATLWYVVNYLLALSERASNSFVMT
jgi:hypothetical protein